MNPTPITQFIQILKSAELTQAKEVKIPIAQARMIGIALVEVLDKLNGDYSAMLKPTETVTIVSLDGGSL